MWVFILKHYIKQKVIYLNVRNIPLIGKYLNMAKIKKKELISSLIVTQSNELVEARYNLPLGEQRLILTMISKIHPDDEDFKEYRINVGEFAEFLGIDKSSVYREFHKIQKTIVSRVLVFYEEDGPLVIGWVSSAKYLEKEGAVLLTFDPKLKPYLLQLKGKFTSCNLNMLLSFKSQYTMRVYMLLKQYQKLKEREIELALLREILGLRQDLHVQYSSLRRHILIPVQKELKAKADLCFDFDEIKNSRRVGAIRFRIISKQLIEAIPDMPVSDLPAPAAKISAPENDLFSLIPAQHRLLKTVNTAIASYEKKYGFAYVKRNILYSNAKAAKSYAGFLNNALKNDWGCDWEHEQQPVPEKKKAPEIWERSGFKTQQEYAETMFRQQMESYGKPV